MYGFFLSDKFVLFQLNTSSMASFFFVFRHVIVTCDPFFNKFSMLGILGYMYLYVRARSDLEVALFGIFSIKNQELRVLKCEETGLET